MSNLKLFDFTHCYDRYNTPLFVGDKVRTQFSTTPGIIYTRAEFERRFAISIHGPTFIPGTADAASMKFAIIYLEKAFEWDNLTEICIKQCDIEKIDV